MVYPLPGGPYVWQPCGCFFHTLVGSCAPGSVTGELAECLRLPHARTHAGMRAGAPGILEGDTRTHCGEERKEEEKRRGGREQGGGGGFEACHVQPPPRVPKVCTSWPTQQEGRVSLCLKKQKCPCVCRDDLQFSRTEADWMRLWAVPLPSMLPLFKVKRKPRKGRTTRTEMCLATSIGSNGGRSQVHEKCGRGGAEYSTRNQENLEKSAVSDVKT